MTPSNDNFADALVIIGPNGKLNWDNIGATTESGETSNGHTVWFKWTIPVGFTGRFVYFSTLPTDDTLKKPLLRTELRIFSGDFPTLEVEYILDQRKHYGGNSPGSYLIVWLDQENGGVRLAQNSLYIRVDGVSEMPTNQREGYFQLEWGPSDGVPVIGKCGSCLSEVGIKTVCIDRFEGPTELNQGDYRQTPWVFNGKGVTTKKYQRASYPAGKYLLRYCSGFYVVGASKDPLTVYQSQDIFPASIDAGSMWVFHSDIMAGLLPSRPDVRGQSGTPIVRPGDFNPYQGDSFGTLSATWSLGCSYVDGAGTFHDVFVGSVTQILDLGGNPVGNPTGTQGQSNPFTLDLGQFFYPLASNTRGAVGDDPRWPSFWHTQPELQRALLCDGHLFHHTGGEILFVYALLRFSGASSSLPEIFDGDISSKLVGFGGNIWAVGPAGPPSWTLMRVMPDIELIEAVSINESNGTANGLKTARLRVRVRNNSVVTWENTTVTPSGFFVDQDGTYWPSPPMTVTMPADDVLDFNWYFVVTDPVGDVSVALADTDGNPMPTFSIHITPLFTVVPLSVLHYNGTSPKYATKPVTKVTFTIANIGNGAPLDCHMTLTPDRGQIAGGFPGHTTAGFQDTIVAAVTLNPSSTATFEIDLEQMSSGPRTVKVIASFSDTGHDYPPTVLTVAVPGL